jgi:hypothetical protein
VVRIKEDQYLIGCQRGLRAAVGRGDLALARTCFDAVWQNPEERARLQWQIPVIVAADSLFYVGELVEFLKHPPQEERLWRKLIYTLTLLPKSRDATNFFVWYSATKKSRVVPPETGQEGKDLNHLCGMLINQGIEHSVRSWNFLKRRLNHYEMESLTFLLDRACAGGLYGDRILLCLAAYLIVCRGLSKSRIKSLVAKEIKKSMAGGLEKPRPLDALPWYVYDSSTRWGGRALSQLVKEQDFHIRIPKSMLSWLWTRFEFQTVPEPSSVKNMTVFHDVWYSIVGRALTMEDLSASDMSVLWSRDIAPVLALLVKGIATKESGHVWC